MTFLRGLFNKYIRPHKGNDETPHLIREAGTAVLFSIILGLFIFVVSFKVFVFPAIDLPALILPNVLADYANEDRATGNFKQLTINPILEKAAQLKANDMAAKSYFSHTSPEGKSPWYWFEQAGYDFSYAGENLAINFNESVDVNAAWMNSPGHRANIMNESFSEIGIATAEGMYQGQRTTFVVQMFGRPAAKTVHIISSTTQKFKPKAAATTKLSSSTPRVLSESVSRESDIAGISELFIATEKASAAVPEETKTQYSSNTEKLLASPSKFLSMAYLAITFVVIIALWSMIFIELRKHHIRGALVLLGLLFIMLSLVYMYKWLLFSPTLVV